MRKCREGRRHKDEKQREAVETWGMDATDKKKKCIEDYITCG